ncbi:MAG: hypothetical protein PVG83_08425 [Acidimicrobiia bacterium]
MPKYFKRHRRQVVIKATKRPEPIFTLTAADVIPQLVTGRR